MSWRGVLFDVLFHLIEFYVTKYSNLSHKTLLSGIIRGVHDISVARLSGAVGILRRSPSKFPSTLAPPLWRPPEGRVGHGNSPQIMPGNAVDQETDMFCIRQRVPTASASRPS